MAILLSEYLGVDAKTLKNKGVFDMVIGIDTKLFIDPLLFKKCGIAEFVDSRKKIILYFKKVVSLIKYFSNDRAREAAIQLLTFPEPKGVSIGYGSDNDDGNAIGPKLAKRLAESGREIYEMGIEDPEIFELLGLFEEDFGPDRLSDMIINIVLSDFFRYTERICDELKIKHTYEFFHEDHEFYLPQHPDKHGYLIFIPEKFLRNLPVASSWEEVCESARFNQELRNRLNKMMAGVFKGSHSKTTKKQLREIIFNNKNNVKELLDVYKELDPSAYDFLADVQGHGLWYQKGKEIFEKYYESEKCEKPKNICDLDSFVVRMINQYKRAIEEVGANKILYSFKKDKFHPHREEIAQLVFLIVADLNCQKQGVFLARESNYGHGPVDFSLGIGYDEKILVEIKKSSNPNLIKGYMAQLPDYEKSEHSAKSYFVVLIVDENKEKIKRLLSKKTEANKEGKKSPDIILIDATIKPSPSKLRT
ncbi:MAG: hypothetical protein WC022_00475 [Parcubacteria group bacterium]